MTTEDLTPIQRAKVTAWLGALGLGLCHDGKDISTLSRHHTCCAHIVRDEHGLYAVCGNAQLRLDEDTQ